MATHKNTGTFQAAPVQSTMVSAKAENAMEMRGYVMSEESDFALKDLSDALEAVAMLTEERTDDVPEMSKEMWGGLMRTFARSARAVRDNAAWANRAIAIPRDLN